MLLSSTPTGPVDLASLQALFTVAFGFVTAIVFVSLSAAGALVAIYAAWPRARGFFYRHTVSAEEQLRDQRMAELDRTMTRYLAGLAQNVDSTESP